MKSERFAGFIIWFFVLIALSLSGCSMLAPCGFERCCNEGDCLMEASYKAVDQLLAGIPGARRISKGRPVLVATLVNIDTLNSSRLGRTLSEHLSTRLTQNGYSIVEMKLRDSVFMKKGEGELLLSRELKEIGTKFEAQAMLVGTYSESRGAVYVTVKLVSANDGVVIAAQDYVLPIDANVRALLWAQNK